LKPRDWCTITPCGKDRDDIGAGLAGDQYLVGAGGGEIGLARAHELPGGGSFAGGLDGCR
jgi:hypothetical protein